MAGIVQKEIDRLLAENARLRSDLRLAVMSDTEYCKKLEADNERLRQLLTDAPCVAVDLRVPDRDYETMSPLDCYEAGLIDAALRVRQAIKAKIAGAIERECKTELTGG